MAYIGLTVAPRTSKTLTPFKGARLHITLAHFERPDLATGIRIAEAIAADAFVQRWILPCVYEGQYEQWPSGPVLCIVPDQSLLGIRSVILSILHRCDIKPSADHTYRPHISLGAPQSRSPGPIYIDGLELAGTVGITRYAFPMALDPFEAR